MQQVFKRAKGKGQSVGKGAKVQPSQTGNGDGDGVQSVGTGTGAKVQPKKPKKPKQPKRITEKTLNNYNYAVNQYIKNKFKAEAAKKIASGIGMEYIILTEKSLKK